MLIQKRSGPYGSVEVHETREWRGMRLNDQWQGKVALKPSARELYFLERDGPGPIPASLESVGWALAGNSTPSGVGLMLGLGCGAGVGVLLHHFPGLELEVVERDEAVLDLCLEHFPLVDFWIREGRLRVILDEAVGFLAAPPRRYVTAYVDVYSGEDALPAFFGTRAFTRSLFSAADWVWCNAIGIPGVGALRGFLEMSDATARPLRWLHSVSVLPPTVPTSRNWLITNHPEPVGEDNSFLPFAGVGGHLAAACRETFETLKGSRISRGGG